MANFSSSNVADNRVVNTAATFTGPFSAGQAVTVLISKVGNIVSVTIPAIAATSAASATATAGVVIPLGLRPTATIYSSIPVQSNSLLLPADGKVEILVNGTINIYLDLLGTAAWSALGNNGWQSVSVLYPVS